MGADVPKWSATDVATLIEKGARLIVGLVRTFKDPEIVLKKITDRTQELDEVRRGVDRDLRAKYDEENK